MQALLDGRDGFHARACAIRPLAERAAEFWITEPVLFEIGNALGSRQRTVALDFIRSCYVDDRFRVIAVSKPLFINALSLYEAHSDKNWGMTDCLSFVVMRENGLTVALSCDRHFIQAGFRALMLETS